MVKSITKLSSEGFSMSNDAFKETKVHGRLDFPFAVYRGDIPDWFRGFPLHWHKEFEIIYVEKGTGKVTVESSNLTVETGDIVLVPCDSVHEIRQIEDEKFVYYNILFKFSLLEENEQSFLYKKYFSPLEDGSLVPPYILKKDQDANRKIFKCLEYFIFHWQEDFSQDLLNVKANMFWAVKEIFAVSKQAGSSIKYDSSLSRMKPLLAYVQNNYAGRISIEEAARLCNYSESFFMKVFKVSTGFTFTEYLNNYRLEKAEEILKETEKNVSEAASLCGFESLSYFIKCFKKKFGVTPHKLKNQEKNEL